MNEKPLSQKIEDIRNQIADVRNELFNATFKKPFRDRFECVEGLLTCGLIALASDNKEVFAHEIKVLDESRGPHLAFRPRGIGMDLVPRCFCCVRTTRNDEANDYLHNIVAFVPSKEIGEQVCAWFGNGIARLDFRPSEPNWIQVKVGACDRHLPNLQHLYSLTAYYKTIREADIREAREFTAPEESKSS